MYRGSPIPSDFSIQVLQERVYEHLNRCVPHSRHFWVDKEGYLEISLAALHSISFEILFL